MVADNLGAGSAYWSTWSIDNLGDRTSQVQHAVAGGAATDTTTSYTYGSGGNQPHTLTATSTTGASIGSTSYGYDADGNMTSRNAGQGSQALGYDDSGNLTSITGSVGGDSSSEYDADGDLLIQKDPGTTTLYLGYQQLALNTSTGVVTGTRYYDLPDGSQVVRTGTGSTNFTYAVADQHGTPSLYLDSTATTATWRQYSPYGGSRGTAVTAPDNHGFLNKPMDTTTGLTVVGAREYDPDTGRFVTDDPVLEQSDPTQLNGYGYAGNNPVVHSDPTGLMYPLGDRQDGSQESSTTVGNNNNGGSQGASNSSNGGGSQNPPKPKRKHWWQKASDWVDDHQGMIAGAVVGFVAFDACMGSTLGVGSVGCLAVAGAAGKLTADYVDGNIHSVSDAVDSVGVGAVEGVLSPGIAALDVINQTNAVVNDVKSGDYKGAVGHTGLAALDVLVVKGAARGEGGCLNSFIVTTGVLMATGKSKPIGDVKVGDKVVSTDPATGKTTDEPVTLLHDDYDHDFVNLTVSAHHHASTIHTTQHHPFWDQTTKKWTDAGDLKVGDKLHSTTGAVVEVERVYAFFGARHMLNLTVNQLHTYYVLAGKTPVLVHNCGDLPDGYRSSPGLEGDPYHPDVVAHRSADWQERINNINGRAAQKAVRRGQGPRAIGRIDEPEESVTGSQWHAQGPGRGSPGVNMDGSFHDGDPNWPSRVYDWLEGYGWERPS